MATQPTDHDLNALLPDYVTNNLGPDERQRVHAHLTHSESARQQLADLEEVFARTKQWHANQPDPPGLQAFLAHVDSNPLPQASAPPPWWKALFLHQHSWMRPAFSVLLVTVIGLQTSLLMRQEESTVNGELMRGVGQGSAKVDVLTVAFKSDATEQRIRDSLLAIGGRFIDGPDGQLGDYRVAVPLGTGKTAVAELGESGVTLRVELSESATETRGHSE